ncbi:MAG: resolvase [Agathobacter sp.]|nr:resolvase [Agathobacter sp.]
MYNTTENFMEKMQDFFPMTREKYNKSVISYGKVLETVIIEDIFMPEVLELLRKNENVELLEKVFQYIEEITNGENVCLIDTLSVTMFEILGNDREILKKAQQYMGPKTTMLQIEADKGLGRV